MKKILAVLIILSLAVPVSAEINGAFFLRDEVSVRAAGMGCAFTALASTTCDIFINPAAIGALSSAEAAAVYKKGLIDSYYGFTGFSIPVTGIGNFSAGAFIFDGGSIEINYSDGSSETVRSEFDAVVNLSYGYNISREFLYGVNFKLISSSLADRYYAAAYAVDFGVLLKKALFEDCFAGIALQNIGTKLLFKNTADPLPFVLRAGGGYRFIGIENCVLLVSADAVYTDNKIKLNGGFECGLFNAVALRAGYKARYTPNVFSLGIGFKAAQVNLDYSYEFIGNIDFAQRISVIYGL